MPRFTPNYHVSEKTTTSKASDFDEMSETDFRKVVDAAAMSNTDRQAAAITKADSLAFHVVHPEFKPTASNVKLMNHWLKSKGLFDNATFPDFEAALADMQNVLDIDKSKAAPRTFVGHFTKREFDSIDTLIAQERYAALHQKAPRSDAEIAFENLPTDEALSLLRDAEKHQQAQANAHVTGQNADVWLHLHPEFVDNKRNGELITVQLRANGRDKNTASVEDFEKAYRQLQDSGLLKLDAKEVRAQQTAELQERAAEALKTHAIFDQTTEEEMEDLPLDELRRRANGNFSGF